jgi:fructokinase
VIDVTKEVNRISEAVHDLIGDRPRVIVAIAGAPASGKSTLASEVVRRLRDQKVSAEVLPMDGFHLDNRLLEERGLLSRKGAPETFDAAGFLHMVKRLRTGEEVVIPTFDRARDISIAGSAVVTADCRVVVAEGNYLLFNEAPWDALRAYWDLAVRLDVALPELRARLIQRWLTHGLSRATATRRAESNDIVNAQRIVEKVLPADVVISGL